MLTIAIPNQIPSILSSVSVQPAGNTAPAPPYSRLALSDSVQHPFIGDRIGGAQILGKTIPQLLDHPANIGHLGGE